MADLFATITCETNKWVVWNPNNSIYHLLIYLINFFLTKIELYCCLCLRQKCGIFSEISFQQQKNNMRIAFHAKKIQFSCRNIYRSILFDIKPFSSKFICKKHKFDKSSRSTVKVTENLCMVGFCKAMLSIKILYSCEVYTCILGI